MQKRMTIVWGIVTAIFVYLLTVYVSNEIMINGYNKGDYNENPLSFMGFYEPYVADYNSGNIAYKNGDYEEAVLCYEEALNENPPAKKECSIRINLVLARLSQIDFDNIDADKKSEIIKILDECIDILCEDGCAKKDGSGHSKDAQQLEEDIEDLKKQLNESSSDDNKSSDNDNNESSEAESRDEKKEQEKQDKLKEDQKKGQEERSGELKDSKELSDFDYYDGKNW